MMEDFQILVYDRMVANGETETEARALRSPRKVSLLVGLVFLMEDRNLPSKFFKIQTFGKFSSDMTMVLSWRVGCLGKAYCYELTTLSANARDVLTAFVEAKEWCGSKPLSTTEFLRQSKVPMADFSCLEHVSNTKDLCAAIDLLYEGHSIAEVKTLLVNVTPPGWELFIKEEPEKSNPKNL